jgi:6-phosphogluconolactonase
MIENGFPTMMSNTEFDTAAHFQVCADQAQTAHLMANEIEAALGDAISNHGQASFVVSGGSTPKLLYKRLSQADLDWSKVTVLLADDRWVDPGQPGSNETFVHESLLTGRASKANFIGMKTSAAKPQDAIEEMNQRLDGVPLPFDVIVLGMGSDGHSLSWFPHAEGLSEALDPDSPAITAITAIKSDVTGEFLDRATLSHAALQRTGLCMLMIKGGEKRKVWEAAQGDGPVDDMPIRAIMRDRDLNLKTYWWD